MDSKLPIISEFITWSEFNQILYFDNFNTESDITLENYRDYVLFFQDFFRNTSSDYLKRSVLKLICVLTIKRKIVNKYVSIALVGDILNDNNETLVASSLKYLKYIQPKLDKEILSKVKLWTDNPDAEISSEALMCLGINELLSINDFSNFPNYENAKLFFTTAYLVTENRVDAEFYILLIETIENIILKKVEELDSSYFKLINNLRIRVLYEFQPANLELEFFFFKHLKVIKNTFEVTKDTHKWFDFSSKIKTLINIGILSNDIKSKDFDISEELFHEKFDQIQKLIYSISFQNEFYRLSELKKESPDREIVDFIEFLDTKAPSSSESDLINAKVKLLERNTNSELTLKTGSIIGMEILSNLEISLTEELQGYSTEKMEIFLKVLEEVIRYTQVSFTGNTSNRFKFLFSASEGGLGVNALEEDLQNSMLSFFEHSKIADGLDHEKSKFVDGGRVDILYKRDIVTIPIELKKSKERPTLDSLKKLYIAQAQTYSSGYDQLGIFVLLELSDKSKEPPPNIKDWFKIIHLEPSTNLDVDYPDFIVAVVIPGNRTSPSSKSTYSK